MASSYKQGSWRPQGKRAPAKSLCVMCKSELEASALLWQGNYHGLTNDPEPVKSRLNTFFFHNHGKSSVIQMQDNVL